MFHSVSHIPIFSFSLFPLLPPYTTYLFIFHRMIFDRGDRMPQKKAGLRICADCGLLRRLYAYGLCNTCYARSIRVINRVHIQRICLSCGKSFEAHRKAQIYCSRPCKTKNYSDTASYKRYVRKSKCPKCHCPYSGALLMITRIRVNPKSKPSIYYRIIHYIQRKGKVIYKGSCSFKRLPIIP